MNCIYNMDIILMKNLFSFNFITIYILIPFQYLLYIIKLYYIFSFRIFMVNSFLIKIFNSLFMMIKFYIIIRNFYLNF